MNIRIVGGLLLAAACAMAAAPLAHAQEGGERPLGQMTLKRVMERDSRAPAEPPVAAPAAPAADAGVVPPVAAGPAPIFLSGAPREYAPAAVSKLLVSVCGRSDGSDLVAVADARGMGEPQAPPADLMRAMPGDARVWRAPASDGELFLIGYGVAPMRCGAAVLHAIPGATAAKTQAQLMASPEGYVVDSTQVMGADVQWTRLRSRDGQFVDVMEYPAREGMPPVVRLDYLPR